MTAPAACARSRAEPIRGAMNTRLLTDLALAPVAGYVGTKLMEPVSSKLYEFESEQDRPARA